MPADRLEKGLFNELNLLEHFALSASSESNFIDWNKVKKLADTKIKEFNIKGNYNTQINELSGGNQQRLMLSLIPDNQSILLLEQPTRGLDFSSAKTIWEMILSRKNKDIAILFTVPSNVITLSDVGAKFLKVFDVKAGFPDLKERCPLIIFSHYFIIIILFLAHY